MMNIVIIGMPGSGKTTLGREVAKRLGMEFVDTDALIEQSEKKSISEIFSQYGERYFRLLETVSIRAIADAVSCDAAAPRESAGLLVSVGGGAAENPENVEWFRRIGRIVLIGRSLEDLEKNIVYNGKRPLLSDKEKLREIYERRMPLYRSIADRMIDNDGSFDSAVEKFETTTLLLGAKDQFLLIGDPVAHSLSPTLHRAIYGAIADCPGNGANKTIPVSSQADIGSPDATGINSDTATEDLGQISYGKVRVSPDGLASALKDILQGSVRGLNVTIPHKKAVIPYLDEVRGDAALAGSVNTVVKEDEKLIGYNTDMEGLSLAIGTYGRSYPGANVTVLGTGGAAVGVCVKAAVMGACSVSIIGRNRKSADEIITLAGSASFAAHDFAQPGMLSEQAASILARTDILINATPLGMSGAGSGFSDLSFVEALPKDALVYDMVYNPAETELIKAAKKRGIAAGNGLSMLIYQGILSNQYFLNMDLDSRAIYEAVSQTVTNGQK